MSKKGKEPASQTLLSFFADPGADEFELHRLRAATSVLSIRLRDILREELGGTYGVSAGFSNAPPLKGYGMVQIQFGSSPDNVDKLVSATLKEIERLKVEGPSADDVSKVKELERRDLETNAKQNAYWLGSMQTVHLYRMGSRRHRAPRPAHRGPHRREHQGDVQQVLPDRPVHPGHAEARVGQRADQVAGSDQRAGSMLAARPLACWP